MACSNWCGVATALQNDVRHHRSMLLKVAHLRCFPQTPIIRNGTVSEQRTTAMQTAAALFLRVHVKWVCTLGPPGCLWCFLCLCLRLLLCCVNVWCANSALGCCKCHLQFMHVTIAPLHMGMPAAWV